MHIVQGMNVGNTVCTPRTDESEEVGGQEVKNKRNTSSDLSDGYRLGSSDGGKRRWRRRRRWLQTSLREIEKGREIDKVRESNEGREDNCSSGRELAVNNEKRLPRCAPGKTKPQPQLKQTLTP